MSFSSLTRRFRKARSKGSEDHDSSNSSWSTPDPHRSTSEPPSSTVAASTLNGEGAGTTNSSLPVPMPTPQPAPVSMPVPQPSEPPPRTPTLTISTAVPNATPRAMDGGLAELTPTARARVEAGPAIKRMDRALDTMGEKVDSLAQQANMILTALSGAAQTLEQSDVAKKIERGIQRFADDIPWLMKGLDELARIHPAVTVAVLAFKAVYALENVRQENDRRVMTLYVEMKDLMMVMVQLKNVESRTVTDPDGRILESRLEELAKKTARDIRECANFCDTFLKKKLLVKVLKGPVWAEKLGGFVAVFAERKHEFQLALAIHNANSLTDVKTQNIDIQTKIDVVIRLFEQFVSADERKLATEVASKGGRTKVRQDDEALKSLIALDVSMRRGPGKAPEDVEKLPSAGKNNAIDAGATTARRQAKTTAKKSLTLDDLKLELREDIDEALERNSEVFTGKFELQVSMLQVALERYIYLENNRVIDALTDTMTKGPHSKIKDPELQKIWQEMSWRGNVKARLFVVTLQDHYRDQFDFATSKVPNEAVASDQWALEFLSVGWLDPIMEAFDDDVSGYVTIAEVNRLMDMRPSSLNWSIPHWLAYWAVGWKIAASIYISKIKGLLCTMREVYRSDILPRNRNSFYNYFDVWWWVAMMVCGVEQSLLDNMPDVSYDRFQDYVELEEARIKGNLEKIKYHIDASDTLALVLGPGRMENSIFPLLYLLLKNDYRKVQASVSVGLGLDEFANSRDSFGHVASAYARRYTELITLFTQQKLDPMVQIKKYASGLLTHWRPDTEFWRLENSMKFGFADGIIQGQEPLNLEGLEIIKDSPFDISLYDLNDEDAEEDLLAPEPYQAILGKWSGFAYDQYRYPARTMLSLHFHYGNAEDHSFHASGVDFNAESYYVRGFYDIGDDDNVTYLTWTMTYPGDYVRQYRGRLMDEYTIIGTRDANHGYQDWDFILKKIPPEIMLFRPPPSKFGENAAQARWAFARDAIIYDIRRKRWDWKFFAARRDARKAYVALLSRTGGPEIGGYDDLLSECMGSAVPNDIRLYESIASYISDTKPLHHEALSCANVSSFLHVVHGARWICVTCTPPEESYYQQVTFCDYPECYSVPVDPLTHTMIEHRDGLKRPHYPSHDFVKVRTIVNRLDWPGLRESAIRELNNIRASSFNCPRGRPELQAPRMSNTSTLPPPLGPWPLSPTTSLEPRANVTSNGNHHPTPDGPEALGPASDISRPGTPDVPHATEQVQNIVSDVKVGSTEDVGLPADEDENERERTPISASCNDHAGSTTTGKDGEADLQQSSDDAAEEQAEKGENAGDFAAPDNKGELISTEVENEVRILEDSISPLAGGGEGVKDDREANYVPEEDKRTPDLAQVGEPSNNASVDELPDSTLGPAVDLVTKTTQPWGNDSTLPDPSGAELTPSEPIPATPWAPSPPVIPPPWDGPYCHICNKTVYMGECWYCLTCDANFICNDCDSQMLILCRACNKPFPQPEWYHREIDDFLCDNCFATGVRRETSGPLDDPYYTRPVRHVHTHSVVLVKPLVPDIPDAPGDSDEGRTERRLASLEDRILAMDLRFEQIQTQLSRFEEMQAQLSQRDSQIQEHLAKSHSAMEKLTDMLSSLIGGRNVPVLESGPEKVEA